LRFPSALEKGDGHKVSARGIRCGSVWKNLARVYFHVGCVLHRYMCGFPALTDTAIEANISWWLTLADSEHHSDRTWRITLEVPDKKSEGSLGRRQAPTLTRQIRGSCSHRAGSLRRCYIPMATFTLHLSNLGKRIVHIGSIVCKYWPNFNYRH
jgi:hypothetical protein